MIVIEIRKLAIEDVSDFVKLRKLASTESEWATAVDEDRAKVILESSSTTDSDVWYGAFEGKKLVGAAHFSVHKQADTVGIGNLMVLKSHQGQGIASLFKATAESIAERNGISKLALYVDVTNKKGLAIYKKWGFQRGKETIVEMTMPVFLTPVKVAATENAIYGNW